MSEDAQHSDASSLDVAREAELFELRHSRDQLAAILSGIASSRRSNTRSMSRAWSHARLDCGTYGGTISVRSNEGSGTTFTVRLPIGFE